MKHVVTMTLAAIAAIMLAGCEPNQGQQPQYRQARQTPASNVTVVETSGSKTVIVQQPQAAPAQQHNSNNGFAQGLLMGHLMSGGGSSRPAERVVTRERVIERTVPAPAPVSRPAPAPAPVRSYSPPAPSAPARTYSAPSTSSFRGSSSGSSSSFRSSSGGRR